MNSLIVKISQGAIEGKEMINDNGKSFRGFLGIPYAKPPIGNLRFKVRRRVFILTDLILNLLHFLNIEFVRILITK